ncbi:MAG: RdgB/HAM1 family non-canonical purine NTP pyrophosphatase [Clostridia bacterium]|nr:RdgB/HAM1 family non-canonical purine NTP pyrophosphatase [Clostridia bacterium]
MPILVASTNLGKIQEIQEILCEWDIITLNDIKNTIQVIENGKTFEENAKKKAKEIYEKTQIPCLADDSGICIKQYNGWPGVETARFLGENKATNSYAKERNQYILNKMKHLNKKERQVDNVTVIAYYDGKEFKIGRGTLSGYIANTARGNNGFGFDEIFELEDGRTLAELTKEEKNIISSRKKALENIKRQING